MFSIFKKNTDPRREKHCPRWQRGGLELGRGEFLCPSSWCLSRATPNCHQSPPGQHCTGCHSAGKSLLGDQDAVRRYCLPGRHGGSGLPAWQAQGSGLECSTTRSLSFPRSMPLIDINDWDKPDVCTDGSSVNEALQWGSWIGNYVS